MDTADNELIDKEFETLKKLTHHSLPIVETQLVVNGNSAFLMREIEGTPLLRLLEEYPNGVPAEHVMWMLERLFSAIGYLHYNKVVHGNIKGEHILINKQNHNVSLLGFSLCITDADKPTAKYNVINDIYTAPEVDKNARVLPNADIYSVGKLAVLLLGGDVHSNGMPLSIDARIRSFIRTLVNPNPLERPNDAWVLWDEVIKLRNDVFGTERFKTLN
ncbi:MAG: protein kinase [Lachnospiraceae bacterium]|nr:protein kinase [Lachnospiraceae bacterium]